MKKNRRVGIVITQFAVLQISLTHIVLSKARRHLQCLYGANVFGPKSYMACVLEHYKKLL